MSVPIDAVRAAAYRIPTNVPEADGTLRWEATTLVLARVMGGGKTGIGYTYADRSAAVIINEMLAPAVAGKDAMAIPAAADAMNKAIRNQGTGGISAMAVSAIDIALWDLKSRLLELPLVTLLGAGRERIAIYGSGGFTSYSLEKLREQLGNWTMEGISRVKMKVGTRPEEDVSRVTAARDAIGPAADLFVDANGAYTRKQALEFAEAFAGYGVRWFEEPVSSDDLEGLRLLRDRGPAGMEIAAGEYGYTLYDFRRLLEAGAVDCLQADATRCGGISGFLQAGALCRAWGLPFSAHTAPAIHAHPCCALPAAVHVEYFHDHVRIENLLFDGVLRPENGFLAPDLSRPGLGIGFKERDAEQYRVG